MSRLFRRLFPDEPCSMEGFHAAIRGCLPARGQVLDLGCGDNAPLARYRTPERLVWGVDFQQHPNLQHADWFRLLGADGTIPFPEGVFDLIASRWVLEHVAEPERFLREVRRVLRPGGAFISLSINAAHYVTWITRLFHLLPHAVTQQVVWRLYRRPCHDTFPAYYRLNSARRLRRAAAAANLELVALERYANPHYFSFSAPLVELAALTDWALEKIRPGWGRIYFVATLQARQAPPIIRSLAA